MYGLVKQEITSLRPQRYLLGALLAMIATTGSPQDRISPPKMTRVDFVLGNVQFALFHELAHLAIGEMEIPIVGPEEQAADYIATLSLIRPLQTPPVGGEKWLEFVMATADAFVILWQLADSAGASLPYWDRHALSIQRFYSITCLLYGSNPERFAELPSLVHMPPQRAETCEAEYARAARSIDWMLETFGRRENEPQKATIAIRFETPRTQTSEHLIAEIQAQGLIEWSLRRFQELVNLDQDATLVIRSCSLPEAAWMPEERELVVCYELLDFYYLLSGKQHDDGIQSFRGGGQRGATSTED